MRQLIGLVLVVVLVAAACGGEDSDSVGAGAAAQSSDGDEAAEAEDGGSTNADGGSAATADEPLDVPTGGDAGDLCALGMELEQNEQFSELTLFDGEDFFNVMDDVWSQVGQVAPGEVQGDIATIQAGLDDLRSVLADADYDVFDPAVGEAIEGMDTAAMDDATERFSAYLSQKCGIDLDAGGSSPDDAGAGVTEDDLQDRAEELENLDLSGDEAEILAQVFGIDVELARCLNDELGGLDPDNVDPSVMTQEVCGTTLLDVISGAGG